MTHITKQNKHNKIKRKP